MENYTVNKSNGYDIVVIGGGPGGYVAAIKAAQKNKKVCIIEKKAFGGTCLNVGCIPTKTLIKTADIYSDVLDANKFAVEGVETDKITISMKKLQERKNMIIKQLAEGISGLLRANGVTIVKGEASFIDSFSVEVNGEVIRAEYFIIATGSKTFIPQFIPLEGETNVITSEEALSLKEVPKSMVIIGGGVIGIEFAYLLNKLGCKVTVIELMNNILPMVDTDISNLAKKRMEKDGIKFFASAKVKKINENRVIYELDSAEMSIESEAVLMAVGRTPNLQGLNIEALGIEISRKAIKTNEALRTNIDNIYAVGDVNGQSMLAHTAEHEGIIAVENICGNNAVMDYNIIPSCIYINPEIGCIGLTEEQAKNKGFKLRIGKFPMYANGKSLVEGDVDGLVKVLVDENTGKLVGAHLYGKHATDMIAELSVAMKAGIQAEIIASTIHPHPTISEAIPEAFMSAVNGRAIHIL